MGCNETKDNNIPVLLCYFEYGNEDQKNYCLRLKDNFHHEKTIRFEIQTIPNMGFSIKFKLNANQQPQIVQSQFDDSENAMNNTLNKCYSLLG